MWRDGHSAKVAIPRVFFSSVLHSAKRVFTKCRCSSRGTLGKDFFAECPRFYPGQPFVHSANKVFPVANRHTSSAFKTQNKYTHAHGSSYQTEPTTTLVTFSSKLKLQILRSNDVERQLELDKKSTSAFDLSCVGCTFYPSPLLFKLCWVSIFCDDGSCKCAFRKISCPVYSPVSRTYATAAMLIITTVDKWIHPTIKMHALWVIVLHQTKRRDRRKKHVFFL